MKSELLAIRFLLCISLASIGSVFISIGSFSSIRSDSTTEMISLEQELYAWAFTKVSEGKLSEEDLNEIFNEQDFVGFSNEPATRSFRGILSRAFERIDSFLNWIGVGLAAIGVSGAVLVFLKCRSGAAQKCIETPKDEAKGNAPS